MQVISNKPNREKLKTGGYKKIKRAKHSIK